MPESSYLGKIDLNASICIQNACEKCDCLTFIATRYLPPCMPYAGSFGPGNMRRSCIFYHVYVSIMYNYMYIHIYNNQSIQKSFLVSPLLLSVYLSACLSLSLFPLPPYQGYDKFDTPISFCWTSPSPSINLLFLWCTLFLNTIYRTLKYRIL